MPSFASAVVMNDIADSVRVALNARFILIAGSPSDTVYALRGRVPKGVDVVLHSDLVITVAGTVNRAKVDNRAIQSSAIAQHLQNYLYVNGGQLGVRIASQIFVDDDDDGKVKLTLSPTRPVLERCSPFLRLSAIELLYACKTPHAPSQLDFMGVEEASEAADPFSPHGFLPLVTALDRIIDKFVVLHLVRKYPLIFGPWRERFDAEVTVSTKVAHAITDIVARSPHTAFRKRCHRLIKAMRKNAVHTSHASANSLRALLSEAVGEEDVDELDDLTRDEDMYASSDDACDALCQAMERLLKCGAKPTLYKSMGSAGVGQGSGKSLDDDFRLSDCLTTSPMTLRPCHDDHGQDIRDRVELRFDEDADATGGSQDRDMSVGGESDLDDDMWLSNEAESLDTYSPPLVDEDDIWGSSQSTLDDPCMDMEDHALLSSHISTMDTTLSDPSLHCMDGTLSDEEDYWFDSFALTPDHLDDSPGPSSGALSQTSNSSPFSQACGKGFFLSSPALNLEAHCRPTSPASGCESHDLDSQAFSPSVDEALEVTTSYFPIVLDDDLACDFDLDMDSSRAFFMASPALSPPPLDEQAEGSEFELEFEFGMGSLDGHSLISPRHSRWAPESPCVSVTTGGNIHRHDQEAAAKTLSVPPVLASSCSVSSDEHIQIRSTLWAIDGDGDGIRQCQGGEHGDENEGSLVARDTGHATMIRARLGEEACAGEGGGTGFLAEPAGVHTTLRLDGFDEGGNEGDMLCFE